MKLLFSLFVFCIGIHSTAFGSCINVSGTYQSDETTAMRFTQNSCLSLRIEFGRIQDGGRIDWYKIPLKTLLNGNPTCDTFGCVTGRADDKKIELERDKEWFHFEASRTEIMAILRKLLNNRK